MDEERTASGLRTLRMNTLRASVRSEGRVDATNSESISLSERSEFITYCSPFSMMKRSKYSVVMTSVRGTSTRTSSHLP